MEESLENVQILQFLLIQKDVTVFNTFISLFLEVLFFPSARNIWNRTNWYSKTILTLLINNVRSSIIKVWIKSTMLFNYNFNILAPSQFLHHWPQFFISRFKNAGIISLTGTNSFKAWYPKKLLLVKFSMCEIRHFLCQKCTRHDWENLFNHTFSFLYFA